MLEIKNLSKKFWRAKGEFLAVDNLTLKVKRGSIFGFIGLNGAGKTTAIKTMIGLLFADSGSTQWRGRDTRLSETKQRIGFMPEQPQFHRHLSAQEILAYVGELFELDEATIKQRTATLLKHTGLSNSGPTAAKDFSKGMSQRLALACALMNEPELLVLDEPLDGLDPIGRAEFKQLIRAQQKKGVTVFLSSHILSDIDELCDEIAVIDSGKLRFNGPPKKLTGANQTLENAFVKLVGKR